MKREEHQMSKQSKPRKNSSAKKVPKEQSPPRAENGITDGSVVAKEEAKAGHNMKHLLELRNTQQKTRPKFTRQESWRYKRLETTWRKPKGVDSKMRKQIRGWPKIVKIGYRGPKLVRGLHPSGYRDVLVHSRAEILLLDPKKDAIRLSAKLGRRYRTSIAEKAEEMGLKILNPRRIGRKAR